ncbi:hypothetical protein TruAng_000909 [Truncatella angustata]|nr:hypothetical protein TruAng_000909 [Truncatella angustata]
MVSQSNGNQTRFHRRARDSKYFSPAEKSALDIDSFDQLGSLWNSAVDARRDYDSAHAHGQKRIAQKSRDIVASAYEVFRDIAPMLELVIEISAPYGAIAIGTISFFLMVANNRNSMETRIRVTMTTIKDNMPSIQLYQQIYNDRHQLDKQLQTKILMAYEVMMRFCIETTNFYKMSGMRRWVQSLMESNELTTLSCDMQSAFNEVRLLAEVLLSKNVNLLRKEISDLRRENKRLQDSADWRKLEKIQESFGLDSFSAEHHEKMLQRYKDELSVQTELNVPFLENLHEPNHKTLLEHNDFRIWQQSSQSQMLLLVGYNDRSLYNSAHCWVSPLTMHITSSTMRRECLYAVYVVGLQDQESIKSILCTVLLQLLRQRSSALQAEKSYAELLTTIQEEKTMDGDVREATAGLVKIALRVMNILGESEPVWIILERVDRCRFKASTRPCEQLLQIMVHLVESSKANVRVLASVNGYDWPVDQQDDAIEKREPERVVTHVAKQRQVFV